MIGLVVGYIEGLQGTDYMDTGITGLALGALVLMLSALSQVSQMVMGTEIALLESISLVGTLFGDLTLGAGVPGVFITIVLAGIYGVIDVLAGRVIYDILEDFQDVV